MEQIPTNENRLGRHTNGMMWPPTGFVPSQPGPHVPPTDPTQTTMPIGPAQRFLTHKLDFTRVHYEIDRCPQSLRDDQRSIPTGGSY